MNQLMDQSISFSPIGDARNPVRNPGQTPTGGSQAGPVFANIVNSTHGPHAPKPTLKTKAPAGAIVGKETKPAAPGKKSSPKAKGAGKAK
jgi:hypothetical protein